VLAIENGAFNCYTKADRWVVRHI